MVDVLDAIHSTLMELNSKLAEMKGHLDLTTAITLSERIGVSTSDLGIEVMIPDVKTVKEIQDPKKRNQKRKPPTRMKSLKLSLLNPKTLARIVVCVTTDDFRGKW